MFNNDGITKKDLSGPMQILANVEMQASVGCRVLATLGVTVDGRKIVKKGTPIKVDLENRATAAVLATATVAMNAVLLHDVDVTNGDGNGTALLFGFVNLNRLETDVISLLTTARGNTGASPLLVFLKA